MSPTTIKDVAEKAKVSVATVSRVINSSEKVVPETRDRVLAVAKQLDYSPNLQAKRLKLGRTHTIIAVLPFLTLPSIVERLRGLQQSLADSEYDLIPYSVGTPEDRESYLASLSNRSRADGILIISMPITEYQVQRFQAANVPVVLIDSFHPDLKRVIVDDVAGGVMATTHLVELGHTRIGFVSDHLDNPLNFSSMKDRHKGYIKTLEEHNIEILPQYQIASDHGREEAKEMAIKLLNLPTPPTAIVAACDTQAIGVLDAANQMNLSVPEDISVVGYDDIRDADFVNLTTIKQPLHESGVEGGKALINMIDFLEIEPLETVLPVSLVIRGTTAAPKA